jgi:hypothetical protein
MRRLYTFLVITLVILSGCSSSRNTTQTPDDVYYSPGASNKMAAATADEYTEGGSGNEYYSTRPSDNYVRLKAQDQARWSYFDDYNAYDGYYAGGYSPYYSTGFGYGYGMPYYGYGSGFSLGFGDPYLGWNSYFLWNSWYNPYFYNPYYGGGVLVVTKVPTNSVYNHLRTFNGTTYREGMTTRMANSNNRSYRPVASSYYNPSSRSVNGSNRYLTNGSNNGYYRPGVSNNNNGGYRPSSNNSFTPSNSGSRPSYSAPVRTVSPSPAPSGGGGGGFRPGRH